MKKILPYLILGIGMPLLFAIFMFAVPDAPGRGKWIYALPLLNLAAFACTLPTSGYKRRWLHLTAGIAATPILFFCNIIAFGWIAIMRSGLDGTQ